ncbi:hypothetical protein V8F20_012848, partial [Naviculisporaceae sp. PSN 640]
KAGKTSIKFNIKKSFNSLNTITILTPIKEITFHIIPINTPFLLYLNNIDHINITFNNLNNTLEHNKQKVPIFQK